MHKAYDWLVIGGGITGSALSYELQKVGFSVLLIERDRQLQGASRFGYGGIPYWSGTTSQTKTLCAEGLERHKQLSDELGQDTEFRNIELLLTIAASDNQAVQQAAFDKLAISPELISAQQAQELEPLLNSEAIAGAWLFAHAHANPVALCQAYQHKFLAMGGEVINATVEKLLDTGVKTNQGDYQAAQIGVCAGGIGRQLLQASGLNSHIYFTHAELLETEPVDLQLRTFVMPANTERLDLETTVTEPALEPQWDHEQELLASASIDVGAIQFSDRRLKIGQLSYVHTNPQALDDLGKNEKLIRDRVRTILPKIADLAGTYHHCLVAFSRDSLPLIGKISDRANIYLFNGFTSPMIYVPPLAQRFAQDFAHSQPGTVDPILSSFSPQRFDSSD